jgi:hypothetical protein
MSLINFYALEKHGGEIRFFKWNVEAVGTQSKKFISLIIGSMNWIINSVNRW